MRLLESEEQDVPLVPGQMASSQSLEHGGALDAEPVERGQGIGVGPTQWDRHDLDRHGLEPQGLAIRYRWVPSMTQPLRRIRSGVRIPLRRCPRGGPATRACPRSSAATPIGG